MITLVGSQPAPRERAILEMALRGAGFRPESVPIESPFLFEPDDDGSLLVTLGDEAAEVLLGDQWPRDKKGKPEGQREIRGYLWDTDYGRVLTTVSPDVAQSEWVPFRVLLDLDLRKAAREAREGCPPLPEREVTIVEDKNELDELMGYLEGRGGGADRNNGGRNDRLETVSEMDRARGGAGTRHDPADVSSGQAGRGSMAGGNSADLATAQGTFVAVDIENDDKLACLGVAPGVERAWVIPAREGWQLKAIREVCEMGLPLVLQNGAYDQTYLRLHNDIRLSRRAFDTMLGWHALQPELAGMAEGKRRKRTMKSLKFLSSIYTRSPWWKDYDFADESERYRLCGLDCCDTLEIAQEMMRQLEPA